MIPVQRGGTCPSRAGRGVIWSHAGIAERRKRWSKSPVMGLREFENTLGAKRLPAHRRTRCVMAPVALPRAVLLLMMYRSGEPYGMAPLRASRRSPTRRHTQDRSAANRRRWWAPRLFWLSGDRSIVRSNLSACPLAHHVSRSTDAFASTRNA